MNNVNYLSRDSDRPDALRVTLEQWHGADPARLVFALVPEADQDFITELQGECKRLDMALAGAIFPALIHDQHFVTSGAWLLRPAPGSAGTLIGDLDGNASTTAARIAATVRPQLGSTGVGGAGATLFMIFDAMMPNIASVLDELYLELGDAVAYLGVNAGSESFQPIDCLFDGTQRIGGGVLCLLLPTMEAVLAHGYQSPEETVSVTASVGNRITQIDWQPAFDVYRAQIKQHYGIELNRENFYQYAVHFPFGIALATGETLVRIPVGVDPDGSIHCVGEVPEYAMLTLLQGPAPGSAAAVEKIAGRLGQQPFGQERSDPPAQAEVMLGFYCAGRRMHLGEAAEQELASLAQQTGERIVGALSLGEIGSLEQGAYPHFHNGTLVCVNWTPE
jgi:hypothetical protein